MEGGREEGWKEGREGGKEGGGKEEGRQEWLNTAYYIKCTRQTSIAEWFVFKITISVCILGAVIKYHLHQMLLYPQQHLLPTRFSLHNDDPPDKP